MWEQRATHALIWAPKAKHYLQHEMPTRSADTKLSKLCTKTQAQ